MKITSHKPQKLQYDSFKEMIENEYPEVCLGENATWDRELYTQNFGMYNTDLLAINLGFFPTPSLKMIHRTHKLFFDFE
jgi:hypothetical protein